MSADLLDLFKDMFEEFSDISDIKIELALDEAMLFVGENEEKSYNHWQAEKNYKYALMYLSAHIIYMNKRSNLGDAEAVNGVVTSKSAGGVSISKSASSKPNFSDGDMGLESTKYGQKYLALRFQKIVTGKTA